MGAGSPDCGLWVTYRPRCAYLCSRFQELIYGMRYNDLEYDILAGGTPMLRISLASALALAAMLSFGSPSAQALPSVPKPALAHSDSAPTKVGFYKKRRKAYRPRVKGYYARRGGYSYVIPDTLSTYGSSRSLYGGTPYYRDPALDRQSMAGPFDHGFFFDSGYGPRGGDSPYMH